MSARPVIESAPFAVEANLAGNTSASDWAKEFARLHGGNEALMQGWFANAIMAGFDSGCQIRDKGARRYRIGLKSGSLLTATGDYTPPRQGQQWLTIGDVSVAADSVEYVRPA